MSSDSLLRIACVGAGSIGREFAIRHISRCVNAEVVAIVDLDISAAQSLADDVKYRRLGAEVQGAKYRETVDRSTATLSAGPLPEVFAYTAMADALDSCDCVYIWTPPLTHASLTLAALAAKKHVLLEKPLAISEEDCAAIVAGAEKAFIEDGLIVNVNIGMRFNVALHTMRDRLQSASFGSIAGMSLRLHFMQWPRQWQDQPWVAQRAQGGALEEVGTHWVFGLLELLGHGTFRSAHCCLEYPDGPDGILSEISCKGTLNFDRGDGVLLDVDIDIQTASALAAAAGKDLYELHVTGSSGSSLTLYDFTRLRNEAGDIVSGGSYGRTECIAELVKAVRENAAEANLVTPRQAHNAQLIVNSMKESTKCKQDQNNTY